MLIYRSNSGPRFPDHDSCRGSQRMVERRLDPTLMSALGQKQTFGSAIVMFAYPRKRTFTAAKTYLLDRNYVADSSTAGQCPLNAESRGKCTRDSMLSRGDTEADDCLLAQCLCGFQPMQTFD